MFSLENVLLNVIVMTIGEFQFNDVFLKGSLDPFDVDVRLLPLLRPASHPAQTSGPTISGRPRAQALALCPTASHPSPVPLTASLMLHSR